MRLKIQCGLSLLNYKIHLIQNFNISYYVRGQDGWMLAKFFLHMTQGEVWVDKNAKKCGQFLAIFAKEAW